MSPSLVLAWLACGFLVLRGIRYLFGARIYFTCALREVTARAIAREQIDPGELKLISGFDADLAAANFRHLGFGHVTPLMTYYGSPMVVSVFANERIPAYAIVRRRAAPEYGMLAELEIVTDSLAGPRLATFNTPFANLFSPTRNLFEVQPDLSTVELVQRHAQRVAAAMVPGTAMEHAGLEEALGRSCAQLAELRELFRARGWTVPTADRRLDRFTLRGAFVLAHYSMKVFGKPAGDSRRPAPAPLESAPQLRIEADLSAVLHVAEYPEPAPGIPWPLIAVISATGLSSFVAMTLLWNVRVAALILAVIAFHEAGHAIAMRILRYRDVHVFFVPLLGAMTIGRPVAATTRSRLAVIFAGPLPGLLLGVSLLAIDRLFVPMGTLRIAALTLLILNGLNLLPFTPFDGGRVLESLSRPESAWRLVIHVLSALGLAAVAFFLKDPFFAALAVAWALLLPRQILDYRLRRSVAAAVRDRADFRGVVRAALETMATARYASWRSSTRQVTARAVARLFSESLVTSADRRWGATAYALAWLPVAIALLLWRR